LVYEVSDVLLVGRWELFVAVEEEPLVLNAFGFAPHSELLLDNSAQVRSLLLHGGVPVILNCVVCAAFQTMGDLSPLVFVDLVFDEKNELLFLGPLNLLDHRIEMVVPAFTALLANSAREFVGNFGPLLGSLQLYKHQNELVLVFGPRTFDKLGVENFLPTMQTLDIRASWKTLSDLLPVLALVQLNCLL